MSLVIFLLSNSYFETAKCQLAAGALQQLCPGVPASLQPLALVQLGHICPARWNTPAPFCRHGDSAAWLALHPYTWTLFLSLVPPLPQISFPLPGFWEQGLTNATIKHFLGECCLLWAKPWHGCVSNGTVSVAQARALGHGLSLLTDAAWPRLPVERQSQMGVQV